jgi:hypothetical protein
VVNFCFLPENEADARTIIAGLVPYLRDSHDPWYLSAFSNEAKLCHQSSRWDHKTHQVFLADEHKISDLLAKDDELNNTDVPAEEKNSVNPDNPDVEVVIPPRSEDTAHHLNMDDNSVSTFQPRDSASVFSARSATSTVIHPKIIIDSPSLHQMPQNLPGSNSAARMDNGSVSKLSDLASRIADLETNTSKLLI